MAIQLAELKYDSAKSDKENLLRIIKAVNNMTTTLNYTLNNFDAADVQTSAGVSLQDLYSLGALKGEPGQPGAKGDKGEKGDKGDPFRYSDFTPTQLEGLVGPRGSQGFPGVGIDNVELTVFDGLDFTLTDGSHRYTASVKGEQGIPGEGIPAGGTRGQILVKLSDEDYDTAWVTLIEDSEGGT